MADVTFEDILKSEEIKTYIKRADLTLERMGYTEHSFPHVGRASKVAGDLLDELGFSPHIVELTRIAGYMHDIGNVINRVDHAQSGAIMSFRILDKMGMDSSDIAKVISAIGNHDESTAWPVNEVAAALIIADKSDVRRSRVRNNTDRESMDIHDRVNYAVMDNKISFSRHSMEFTLSLTIDVTISSVLDYFEIFISRMKICCKAAEYLGLKFHLLINDTEMC